MSEKWRPPNWDEIVKTNISRVGGFFNPDTPVIFETDRLVFEAGADAMLDALFKLAEESPTKIFTIDSRSVTIYGIRR